MGGDSTEGQTYDDVFWAGGPVQLTPDEWWLTRLCELRNAIVHGDEISADLWEHDGHHQLDHIHDRLVAAMRVTVANLLDDPVLEVPLGDRSLRRAAQEFLAEHGSGESAD